MNSTLTARRTFAAKLYDKLAATNGGKNLFLSPISIEIALAMCAIGGVGATRDTLTDLIGAPEDVNEQNESYASLLKSFGDAPNRSVELKIANALWAQQGLPLKPAFKEQIAEYYRGHLSEVDFQSPEQACKSINAWVRAATRGTIEKLLGPESINADMRLVLTNAIYFRGKWEETFEKAHTQDQTWHGPSKPSIVPLMHREGGYLYYESEDLQAVSLPYKGRQLGMLVVLPREVVGLSTLESQWTRRGLFQEITDGFDAETVTLHMPRFRIETEYRLKSALCALHADLPFSDGADFSGICDTPLKLSEVHHKAFVEVDEEGTEAAAATAACFMLSSGGAPPRPEPKIFRADHPFMFFIWDRKSNTIFFSGRVLNP